jgi:transposase
MRKTFRPYSPDQILLLPPSPRDWLPKGHLAFFLVDLLPRLDLSDIYAHYERELRGFPPHDPRMMLGLLLCGYCVGVRSSRKIEQKTHEDIAFRFLAGGHHPDHSCICDFRNIHQKAFQHLFLEVVGICRQLGMASLGHVAIDGTKRHANASKHKAMSFQRMKEEDERLRKVIKGILEEAEAVDRAEDEAERRGELPTIPEELLHKETRQAKIQEAIEALKAEAKATKEQERKEKAAKKARATEEPRGRRKSSKKPKEEDPDQPKLPFHRVPAYADGTPKPKAQRNFTDPESRIMKTSVYGYIQGYNCQIAVSEDGQIILAQAVTNQPPDPEHLPALLEGIHESCGEYPENLTGDAGYFSEANVAFCEERLVEPYLSTARQKHNEPLPKVRGRPPANMTPKQRMHRKLATRKGARIYARRKAVVEPVFGQMKEARGCRRFLQRGLTKVRNEFTLECLTHNLLKLFKKGVRMLEGGFSLEACPEPA